MIIFMQGKIRKWATTALVASIVLLAIFFVFTDPREVGLLGILVVVFAVYVFFASLIYLTVVSLNKKGNNHEQRQLLVSLVLAFAPVFLIIFNSLGAVGVVELALIALFEMVAVFLITKRTK